MPLPGSSLYCCYSSRAQMGRIVHLARHHEHVAAGRRSEPDPVRCNAMAAAPCSKAAAGPYPKDIDPAPHAGAALGTKRRVAIAETKKKPLFLGAFQEFWRREWDRIGLDPTHSNRCRKPVWQVSFRCFLDHSRSQGPASTTFQAATPAKVLQPLTPESTDFHFCE